MDCRTARLLLAFDRPLATELAPPDAEALRTHLADCGDCGRAARDERAFDDQLGQAIRAVPEPAGLRDRLLTRLTSERDDWYRRWLLRGTGMAAAVAFLSWGLWTWTGPGQTALDLQAVNHSAMQQVALPPAEVEKWYRDRGVTMVAPRQFQYQFLAFFNQAEFQGRSVPHLVFQRGNAYARVFVLNDRQFDLSNAAALEPIDSGGFKVVVQTYPVGGPPRFAFVILYTGDSLEEFLVNDTRPST